VGRKKMEKSTKIAKGSKVSTKIKPLGFHNLSSHGISHEDYLMEAIQGRNLSL
jgi:hypothetical protein